MDNKQRAKLFKALENFTSTDKTRPMLHHVYVKGVDRIEATDGHKLIQVNVKGGHGLAPGFYDGKKALALLKADVEPQPVPGEPHWEWPDFNRVIPAVREGVGALWIDISPALLADCCEGIRGALDALDAPKQGMKVRPGENEMEPIRFDAKTWDESEITAVLMPMRV
jgi:hypothetical protein